MYQFVSAASPFTCIGKGVGYFRNQDDCSMYFFCEENSSLWTFMCSPAFAFDISINECRPQAQVPGCVPDKVDG